MKKVQGNLGWAYMQKTNYMAAEAVYQKAQMMDPDANKACNLAFCLIKQARNNEARRILEDVLRGRIAGSDDCRSRNRAKELLMEIESTQPEPFLPNSQAFNLDEDFAQGLEKLLNEWAPSRSRRLPIFEEISSFRDQLAC